MKVESPHCWLKKRIQDAIIAEDIYHEAHDGDFIRKFGEVWHMKGSRIADIEAVRDALLRRADLRKRVTEMSNPGRIYMSREVNWTLAGIARFKRPALHIQVDLRSKLRMFEVSGVL